MRQRSIHLVWLVALAACRVEWGAATSAGDAGGESSGDVMVYTSAYPPVVAALDALAKTAVSDTRIRWFQAGSEKLAARLDAEILAGNPGADLLMSSDPVYYVRLKRAGALVPYASLRSLKLDRRYVDADGAFVACRLSAMGLVYLDPAPPPRAFADLLEPRLTGKVTLPDPLGSGTMFSTLLVLDQRAPNTIAQALRKNRATSSGGGTAVVDRILRGEASAGVALVENALMAKNARLHFVVPSDGAVVVPGHLAIVKGTKQSAAAKRVYDFLLSEAAQRIFIANHLHSPFAELPAPDGAPPLAALESAPIDWPALADHADAVRAEWAKAFRE
ncbi:MAG: extracellular solute-binding protein [Deltaproteobacteria bacterium]|nr:extracellular solute-binding protein [Deltaproteobacteria bacterium]